MSQTHVSGDCVATGIGGAPSAPRTAAVPAPATLLNAAEALSSSQNGDVRYLAPLVCSFDEERVRSLLPQFIHASSDVFARLAEEDAKAAERLKQAKLNKPPVDRRRWQPAEDAAPPPGQGRRNPTERGIGNQAPALPDVPLGVESKSDRRVHR